MKCDVYSVSVGAKHKMLGVLFCFYGESTKDKHNPVSAQLPVAVQTITSQPNHHSPKFAAHKKFVYS